MGANAKAAGASDARVAVSFKLPGELIVRLKLEAVRRRCWPANLAEEAIRDYLERSEGKAKGGTR